MRNLNRLFVLFGLSAALLAGPYHASAQDPGFYFKFGVGPSFTEDVKIQEFFGVTDLGSMDLDPGVRLDLGVGYQFERWIAAEFESGFIFNSIDRFGPRNRVQDFGDSSLSSVPLMLKLVLQAPIHDRFVPFAGAGAGGIVSILDLDDVYLPEPDVFIHGSESDVVFAWQVFGGLRFILNERFDISLSYKYLRAQSPDYDIRPIFFGEPFERIKLGKIDNHSVMLGATWRF
jgi:opacity protein-like surface antigen